MRAARGKREMDVAEETMPPTETFLRRLRWRTVVAGAIAFVVPFGLFLALVQHATESYVREEFESRLRAAAETNAALLDGVLPARTIGADPESLRTRLLAFGLGETEDAFLATAAGLRVTPSRRGVPAVSQAFSGDVSFDSETGVQAYLATDGKAVLAAHRRLQAAPFILVVQVDLSEMAAPVRQLRRKVLLYVAPFLTLGVVLALGGWRYAMHHIERLARNLMQAVLVARQRESERDRVVHELADRLDQERELARQKSQFQTQLAEYEKYAALAQLALGAAHEINNPLLGILSHLELERKNPRSEELREETDQCIEGTKRIASTLRGLVDYARPGTPQLVPVSLEHLITDTLAFLHHHPLFRHIELQTNLAPGLPGVVADAGQLSQILMNLLLNAAEATPEGGRIEIGARPTARGNAVEIWVEDTGSGIPADVLPHVFQPFFTTKKGKGTGLGLSITQVYVRNHGGEIGVQSEAGHGTRVHLTLPLAHEGNPVEPMAEVIG